MFSLVGTVPDRENTRGYYSGPQVLLVQGGIIPRLNMYLLANPRELGFRV